MKNYIIASYEKIDNELKRLEQLIEEKDIQQLQHYYKDFKNWLKEEHREYQKDKYEDTNITQWYMPLLEDIYVNSFSIAKTNGSINDIKNAVYDAINNYAHYKDWIEDIKNYKE